QGDAGVVAPSCPAGLCHRSACGSHDWSFVGIFSLALLGNPRSLYRGQSGGGFSHRMEGTRYSISDSYAFGLWAVTHRVWIRIIMGCGEVTAHATVLGQTL